MADASPVFPGQKQSVALQNAYILTGEIMTGKGDAEAVALLESCFEQLPLLYQVFVAWCLGTVHAGAGTMEGVEKMRQFLQEHAPYCTGLALPEYRG